MNKKSSSAGRLAAFSGTCLKLYLTGLILLSCATTALSAGRQVLQGQVPAAVAHAQAIGPLGGETRLNLALSLPLRNRAALEALLQRIYDPGSPTYQQYLTPEQFTERFGATEQDYQRVIDFANANGLTVTYRHPNRLVLDVAGSASEIERTFQVHLRVYQHPTEARTFFAPDTEPSAELAVPLLNISGLDNYSIPRPKLKPQPIVAAGTVTPKAGSGPSGSYRGNDFRAAYVPGTSLTGAGQSVGLLQFDGYYANDITTYASQAGLPNPTLVNVPVDGGVSTPGSGNSEVALDIEMVMSMAPGVSTIYVYEAPNPSPWVDLLSRMANDNLAKQLSCSWGGGPPDASAEQIFRQMAAQGQSFYNATGDSDAFTGPIAFPSESTNITQVGGTTLTTTGPGGSYVSETVWNWGFRSGSYVGSSGGVSTYYGLPVYQQGISMDANQGSTTMRNVPDVALTGDNVYVVYNNGSAGIFGGTSCAAPLWAGLTALINQQAATNRQSSVGFINPAIYAIGKGGGFTSVFHDTTTGNNFSSSSPTKYAAVVGYDLCTGWGTPKGTNLINALTSAVLVTNGYTLTAESYLPGNGAFDPGETVTVNFSLMNAGLVNSTNVVATLQPGNGVVSPSAPQSYGAIAAGGGAATRPFTFTATGTCGGTMTATLQLQDGAVNVGVASFSLQLGRVPTPLIEGFDAVTAPALPAGWSTATSGAQSVWRTTTAASDTAPNAAFTAGAAAAGVNELVSPAFSVGSTTAQLSFRNNYNLQNDPGNKMDGGVLEISISGNDFQDILAAGGSFTSGGYVGTLSSARGNPLGGRQAWTGTSGGFITTVVQLPAAAAGQMVRLKWRCGTDNSGSSTGWYIDTISLTDTGYYVCASPSTPTLALTPAALSFGYAAVGQSVTQNWAVVNAGQGTLSGSAAVAAPFAVVSGSPFSIGGAQTGYVAVAFSPLADLAYAGNVAFTSNGGNSTNAVTGTGAFPVSVSFSGTPRRGATPLLVTFTDASTGTITNRAFAFGDGATTNTAFATVQHTYLNAGTNDVVLTVSGPLGSAALTHAGYVVVTNDFWFSSFGDGVPDWWRAQYFGSGTTTNEVSCATCDPDADGFNNLSEFFADTNPTNSASYLGMTSVAVVPGGLRLDWHGGTAARQFLQQRFDLLSTNDPWADIFTNEPPTLLATSVTNGLGTNQTQFFRVRAVRP